MHGGFLISRSFFITIHVHSLFHTPQYPFLVPPPHELRSHSEAYGAQGNNSGTMPKKVPGKDQTPVDTRGPPSVPGPLWTPYPPGPLHYRPGALGHIFLCPPSGLCVLTLHPHLHRSLKSEDLPEQKQPGCEEYIFRKGV